MTFVLTMNRRQMVNLATTKVATTGMTKPMRAADGLFTNQYSYWTKKKLTRPGSTTFAAINLRGQHGFMWTSQSNAELLAASAAKRQDP